MKRLLIIGWVWPEPKSSAAGSRMMQIIELFQQQNYCITFASPAQQTEHMEELSQHGINSKAIALNCSSFDEFMTQLQPTIVMYDRYMMEEQFGWRVSKACPNAMTILDTEDLQSLRNARHQAIKKQQPVEQADLYTELAIREIAAIYRCDLTIMISLAEVNLLQDYYGVDKCLLMYLPFLYDNQQLNLATPSYAQRDHFISIGNFRHAPNWDAVLWLKQQIWPRIRKQLPKAQLHVYGAYPPKKATDLHDDKTGFLVKGWAENALTVMQSARVCLAPLRFGAGMKGKLAEAMICGTPSITTAIGAEGMTTNHHWGGAIAQCAQSIAEASIALYESSEQWQQASKQGKANAQQLFNRTHYETFFADKLTETYQRLIEHRKGNFIGMMLNHHSHKSTQYMSQWIEEKNKHT